MRTILVGYDGTRAAERALRRAAELAGAFGSRIVVVSVAPPRVVAAPGAFGLLPYATYADALGEERVVAEADEARWEQHRDHVRSFLADAGVPAEFAGVVGHPPDEIVDLAEQQDADLIVVGTREPGFVERLLSGSVSQAVARRAHRDVLIVHPDDDG